MYIRALTVYLVRKGTLTEYVFLEHGAHWAIGALAAILLFVIKLRRPRDHYRPDRRRLHPRRPPVLGAAQPPRGRRRLRRPRTAQNLDASPPDRNQSPTRVPPSRERRQHQRANPQNNPGLAEQGHPDQGGAHRLARASRAARQRGTPGQPELVSRPAGSSGGLFRRASVLRHRPRPRLPVRVQRRLARAWSRRSATLQLAQRRLPDHLAGRRRPHRHRARPARTCASTCPARRHPPHPRVRLHLRRHAELGRADAVVTLYPQGGAPIEIRLDESTPQPARARSRCSRARAATCRSAARSATSTAGSGPRRGLRLGHALGGRPQMSALSTEIGKAQRMGVSLSKGQSRLAGQGRRWHARPRSAWVWAGMR